MDIALLLARFLLAGVFIVAGAAKLADRKGSRQTLIDFGVPAPLVSPLAVLLPLSELAVAVCLIPRATAWWGAVGALALLTLFVVGIGANLARGRKPDCHCFGQLHSAPAGWETLARNGVLAAVAGFVVVWGGSGGGGVGASSAMGWVGNLSTAQAAGLVVGLAALGLLLAQWWLLFRLLEQNGRLLVRVEALESGAPSPNGVAYQPPGGLPIGAAAPEFELAGLRGETLTPESLVRAREKAAMLLFTDPNCDPCTAMLPEISRWQKEHAEELSIPLVSRGTVEENRAKATEYGLREVFLQKDWEVSEAYGVQGTPSAVLIRSDGAIGSPVLEGEEAIRGLLAYAVGEHSRMPAGPGGLLGGELHPTSGDGATQAASEGSGLGEPAPEIELPDLSGETVALADFRGEKTLVLFWDPRCDFCREMLSDLKEWEADPPEGAPKLLVVSVGTAEANREMGLRSPVVLDERFAVAQAFGADGTPSAVLVDERGRIASELAVGAPAVLKRRTAARGWRRSSVTERDEWDAAVKALDGSVLQSWAWGEWQYGTGDYDVERIRVEGPQGTGLAQVLIWRHGPEAYLAWGPVLSGEDEAAVARELFAAVDEVLEGRQRPLTLTVEPPTPLPLAGSEEAAGFVRGAERWATNDRTVVVPLLDDEALLAQMSKRRRYDVRLGQRRGVVVYVGRGEEGLATFYRLLEETARRTEFSIEESSYYESFMRHLTEEAVLLFARTEEGVAAGAIITCFGSEATWQFGASSTQLRVPGATAYLQYEAMRLARARGCTRYDMWGILGEDPPPATGDLPRSRGEDFKGVHQFKLGFGGDMVAYPPPLERRYPMRRSGR